MNIFIIINVGGCSMRGKWLIFSCFGGLIIFFQNFGPSGAVYRQPNLNDIFVGQARFESLEEAEELSFKFKQKGVHIFGQKMNVLYSANSKKYFAFTRKIRTPNGDDPERQIVLLESNDGINFEQKSEPLFDDLLGKGWTIYDPHVAYTGLGNNKRFIMTMECSLKGRFGPSLCVSETKTPTQIESWSHPKLMVQSSPYFSASTGVSLYDPSSKKFYISWTAVDDENYAASTKATQMFVGLDGQFVYKGRSAEIGRFLLRAVENPNCNNAWDCNNLDMQDWKKQGAYFYAIYNGGNYFRCDREENNRWALAIRRSRSALGSYTESSGILIDSTARNICGIGYPVINNFKGETYMYFTLRESDGTARAYRSKLIWGKPTSLSMKTKNHSLQTFVATKNDNVRESIEKLYVYLLGRSPTNQNLTTWSKEVDKVGFRTVASRILNSKEHNRSWDHKKAQLKVRSLYKGLLNREPSSQGIRYHIKKINQEKNKQKSWSRFLNSREFTNKWD